MSGCLSRNSTNVTAPQTPAKYGAGLKIGGSTSVPRAAAKTRTVQVPRDDPSSRSSGAAPSYGPVHLQQSPEKINDEGEVGANTHLYLNRKVPKLLVEVDAVKGYEPSPSALRILRTRLGEVAEKPAGIDFLPTRIIPRTEDGDAQESFMAKTERKYRRRHSTSSAIVLYVLYSDGQTGGVIGAAYSSSAFVVFKQAIAGAATPLVTAEEIEKSVIVHEAGHVLALVNIGYHSPRNHEDADHRGHSNNAKSVMYWAVDNVGVVGLLGGSTKPPTGFDDADRADLRDLRDGKLK